MCNIGSVYFLYIGKMRKLKKSKKLGNFNITLVETSEL